MPDPSLNRIAKAHHLKAKRFLEQYRSAPNSSIELRVVALFYCGLHLIEMYTAEKLNEGFTSHRDRDAWLRKNERDLCEQYQPLERLADAARYYTRDLGLSADDLDLQYRERNLRWIQDWAIRKLGVIAKIEDLPASINEPKDQPTVKAR